MVCSRHHLTAMRLSRNLLVFTALCQSALAAAPTPVVPTRYEDRLVKESPFTTKRRVVTPPPGYFFADYSLAGVTPLQGGYLVTLFNRKNPEERISIPGNSLGFSVVEVHPGNEGPLSTSVTLSNGNQTGVVGFDEKLLVVKKATMAAKPKPSDPNVQMPGATPLSRPRVLPVTH